MPHMDFHSFAAAAPDAVAGLTALGSAVDAAGLEKPLTELVKLRVSQMNGCAFCLQYHLTLARKHGIAPAKLDLVAACRDAGVFSAREKAALAWAEQLTLQATAPLPADAFAALRQHFSENEAMFLTVAVGTINAWNRIGAGLGLPPML